MKISFESTDIPIYMFDGSNADGDRWAVGEFHCPKCKFHFIAVWRSDRAVPNCPKCVVSDRWRLLEPEPDMTN